MKHKMYDIVSEAVKGEDNIKKLKEMISYLVGYKRKQTDTYRLRTSVLADRSEGSDNGEPFKEGPLVMMGIDLFQPDLNLINGVLKDLGQDIQSKGYGDMECVFSIEEIMVEVGGVKVDVMTLLPTNIKNDLKYEHPTLQEVLLGDNIFELNNDVLPKVPESLSEWIVKIKKKGVIGYEALKRGIIDGVSYTLSPRRGETEVTPEIHVTFGKLNPGQQITPKMVYPIIHVRITSVSDRDKLYETMDKITDKYYKITGGKMEISTGLS
jgi:hypothetical protein